MNELRPNHEYDFHFKAWNFSIQQIKMMLDEIKEVYELSNDKFIFRNIKYHNALAINRICYANGSVFFIDNETEIATVAYKFNKRIGFFNASIVSTITKFVETMEKQNLIDYYNISQDRIVVGKDDFEFVVSASATKLKEIESAFFVNVILLILKTEYQDRFYVNFEPDQDVYRSIKYSNKMLSAKNRLIGNELVVKIS